MGVAVLSRTNLGRQQSQQMPHQGSTIDDLQSKIVGSECSKPTQHLNDRGALHGSKSTQTADVHIGRDCRAINNRSSVRRIPGWDMAWKLE